MPKDAGLIYQIKVLIPYYDFNYGNAKPLDESPYRVLEVEEHTSLFDFADIILWAFQFENDHMFGFYDNLKNHHKSFIGYEIKLDDPHPLYDGERFGDVEKATIDDMLTRKGEKWLFLFDYGDKWKFWVSLVEINDRREKIRYPQIVEKFMEAPSQYGDYEEEE